MGPHMVRLIMMWMLLGFFALIENSAFLDGSFRQNIVLIKLSQMRSQLSRFVERPFRLNEREKRKSEKRI